jgi:hypothetical protein
VTGEEGIERYNTIAVSGLNATEESSVDVRGIGSVAITLRNDARVDTSGIAVPDISIQIFNTLTGIDVDKLNIEDDWHARLSFLEVRSNQFTLDIERAGFTLGVQHAGRAAAEKRVCRSVGSNTRVVHQVRGGENIVGITSAQPTAVQIVQAMTTSRGTSIQAVGLESLSTFFETTTGMLSELALHQFSVGIVFFVFAWVSQGEWNSHADKADIPQSSESHVEEVLSSSFSRE